MSYLEDIFSLEGRTAVVSGGAGAIGTVMSDALLKAGANVVVWSKTRRSLDAFKQKYANNHKLLKKILTTEVDASDEQNVERAFVEAADYFATPEILINGVGGNHGKGSFVDIDIETFKNIVELNLIAGLVVPTKVFCKKWIDESVQGSIVNLTSMTSYTPLSGVWAYDAAKSATLNLTMATANEFAEYGIRVNAIAPGFFLGKQNRALLVDEKTGAYTKRGEAVINRTPFKRFGEVSELAGATVFLANQRASGFITGVSLPVDGGYLVHNI